MLLGTPGFRAGRSFSGIHLETFAGALVGFIRSVRGEQLGLFEAAGAVYIDVPDATPYIQAGLGIGIGLVFAWLVMKNPPTSNQVPHLLAGVTLALLLASPLLSAQFLLWPLLFIALIPAKVPRWGAFVLSILTLAYVVLWTGLFTWPGLWLGLIVVRNAVMLLMILGLAAGTVSLNARLAPE